MSKTNSDKTDNAVWDAAFAGDFEEVKLLVQKGGSVHMSIMAVGTVVENAEDKKGEVLPIHKEIFKWALENGSCLLWSFTQKRQSSKFTKMTYNKPISMLKGPGEVPRGTFNKTDS